MDDVPNQLKPYLNEIADQLWSNNAAVMVGAGFSRNAKPVGPTSASFPSWQELGDHFFEKLQGQRPSENARYLSIPKLAEQVEAAFGRPSLDQLLRDAIPDLRYEPSPLHSQLLNLPWKDVFTTNYDTLLERARASVTLKHYDVVATKDDLLYANQPRIVKLHGSFPSTTPFVITEEDYRRYPSDHAPFVNTVRQSLLENTLCLIGFSGDDPNFLQWIGWIRDHIGREAASKIYLIGVFNTLGEGDKKLLDRRGIVVVDLSDITTDPGDALNELLKFLADRKPGTSSWPQSLPSVSVSVNDPDKYQKVVIEWRHQRSKYPGWIIVPRDRRLILWRDTKDWLLHICEMLSADRAQLETPLDLDLAFELAWRLDRCLFPLIEELPSFLKNVAKKYSDKTLQLPENVYWTKKSIFEAVANIQLWLLRHYREEGQHKEWQDTKQVIQKNFKKLLPEHKARLQLEEALQALFRFEPDKAKRLLVNDWQSNDNLPFWEAKRAALMAELGEVHVAHSILETSLSIIRQQSSLTPIIEDYTLVSQESTVMLLLWTVERGRSIVIPDPEESGGKMSERWNDLARYKCDPQREIELLSARLQQPAVSWQPESKTHHFELGRVSRTFHSGPVFDNEAVTAYGMLRMHEDIGMPYRIGHTIFEKAAVESTLPRIRPYSPHWALVSITRLGEASTIDKLFDREYLSNLRSEDVDRLFEIYLPAFKRTIAMVNEPDSSKAKGFESLAKTLPDILSRLCYKCSPVYRERLVEVLRAIYGSRRRYIFTEIVDQFARRLFESMSIKERARTVPLLIDFPILDHLNEMERQKFINPVLWIRLPASLPADVPCITEERIDKLFDQVAHVSQNRDWAMASLVLLHLCGKLKQLQSDHLGKLLWDAIRAPGVPAVAGYYSFEFIRLPHPEDVDPKPRIKEHLQSSLSQYTEHSISINLNNTLDELLYSARIAQWTNAEAVELVKMLVKWWNTYRHELKKCTSMPFVGAPIDFVRKAIRALSEVFSYLPVDSDSKGAKLLRKFREGLPEHIPASVLDAAILNKETEFRKELLNQVVVALLHNNYNIVLDALLAAKVLAHKLAEDSPDEFAPVAATLVQGIQWRHRPQLSTRLWVVADLVEKHHWFLSLVEVTDLLTALEQIAEETSKGIKGNDEDGVIMTRAAAGSLAFTLSKYYQESGSSEPKVIQRWRELCSDPNEFSEVKNSWPDFNG